MYSDSHSMNPLIRLVGVVICGLIVVLFSGCKSKEIQAERGTFQEAVDPVPLPADSGVSEIGVEWESFAGEGDTQGFAVLEPKLNNGVLYTASRNGRVTAFGAEDGQSLWRTSMNTSIYSGVGVGDGIAVVGLDNGQVVALSTENGEELWRVAVDRQLSSIAAIGRSRVVVRTSDGLILGLRADNGERVWVLERRVPQLSMQGDSTPVITGDAVLVGLPNGKLIANNVVTGREYWETGRALSQGTNVIERMSDADSAPLVQGNSVFSAVYQGDISALRLNDASVRWRANVSSRQRLSLLEGILFATDDQGGLTAINEEDGSVLWTQMAFMGRGISHPQAIGDRVLIGDASGNLHSIERKTGALVETLNLADGAIRSLQMHSDNVIVYSNLGEIFSVSLRTRLDL
ncbi:MAG: outer membrane protein assembly factor BamB [Pseudomonadota bacterium]